MESFEMKKITVCLFYVFYFFHSYASYSNMNDMDPSIYADISQSAINNAVSFDGPYCSGGLGLLFSKYGASISGGNSYSSNTISIIAPIIGAGYWKTLKNDFLFGIDMLVSFSKKEKKYDNWNIMNSDFNGAIAGGTERQGKLSTDIITPSLGIKFGYVLKEHKLAVFGKLVVSKMGGKYSYYSSTKNCNVNISALVPGICIGWEIKINKKIGISFEVGTSINKTVKKTSENLEHRVKLGKTDIKILGTYSFGN
jgi:hypothetical protein